MPAHHNTFLLARRCRARLFCPRTRVRNRCDNRCDKCRHEKDTPPMTQVPTPGPDIKLPDPEALGRSMADIAARSQKLVAERLRREAAEGLAMDPLNIGGAFMEMTSKLLASPGQMVQAQMGL